MKSILKKMIVIAIVAFMIIQIVGFDSALAVETDTQLLTTMGSNEKTVTGATSKVNKIVQTIIVIARIVAVAVAVGMLIVLGMKYMTAAPSEKADIKKSAVVYVVGAVLLFGAVGVLSIIAQFSTVVKQTS